MSYDCSTGSIVYSGSALNGLNNQAKASWAFWTKGTPSVSYAFLIKRLSDYGGSGAGGACGVGLYCDFEPTTLASAVRDGETTTNVSCAAQFGAGWVHHVVTFDGSLADTLRIKAYKDGVLQTMSGTANSTAVGASDQPLTVDGGGVKFAECAAYADVLTGTDITNLSGGTLCDAVSKTPVFYVRLKDDATSLVGSLTIDSNAATLASSDHPTMTEASGAAPVHLLRTQQLGAFAL